MSDRYFSPDIPEERRKYCACRYHVMGKMPLDCIRGRRWKEGRSTECPNPYAVCRSKHYTDSGECFNITRLSELPEEELRGYAAYRERELTLPRRLEDMSKEELYTALRAYQNAKGKAR